MATHDPDEILARFERDRPPLVPVPDADYYLAGIFDGRIFLAQRDVEAALEAVRAEAARREDEEPWEPLATVDTLEDLFELVEAWPEIDDEGNLVGLGWPADGGPYHVLAAMAPWVREGSYFLLQADDEVYWKVAFEGGRLVYYTEPVPEGWLERIRAQARQVTETLSAAGWTLEREWMAARKADIERFYGAALKAEMDMDCPATYLSYKGTFKLKVSYDGRAKRSWLSLKLQHDLDRLDLGVTLDHQLDALLAAIVEVQDTLGPDTWEAWLGPFVRTFEPSINANGSLFKRAKALHR